MMDLQVEVKELLKIIEEIRRKYPEKETITSLDILQVKNASCSFSTNNLSTCTKRMNWRWKRREETQLHLFPRQWSHYGIPSLSHVFDLWYFSFADEQDLEDRSVSRIEDTPFDSWVIIVDLWSLYHLRNGRRIDVYQFVDNPAAFEDRFKLHIAAFNSRKNTRDESK